MPGGPRRIAAATGSSRGFRDIGLRPRRACAEPRIVGRLPAATRGIRGGKRGGDSPARPRGDARRKQGRARGFERFDRGAGRTRRNPRSETARPGRRRHSRVLVMNERPLSGRGIVVTRPREHAMALAERIRAAGADPILFPTIEILPPENAAAVSSLVARLDGFQLAIFVSPTAAMRGHAMVMASRNWPKGLRVAAVGIGTTSALEERGFHAVIAPSGETDSETLAELPELQDLKGRSVVIFRGRGGREWLRTRLEARGARVEYAECYRRARPDADAGELLARWQRGGIEAVSITSAEGLANFFEMLGPTGRGYLRATPVFVPHPRIALAARKLDLREIVVTGRGDVRTVAEMTAFFAKV